MMANAMKKKAQATRNLVAYPTRRVNHGNGETVTFGLRGTNNKFS